MRVSGPQARAIAARVFRGALRDRAIAYGTIVDVHGAPLDRGLALRMDAPRTVTGEDVVELHVHGSPVVARETLRALLHAGARAAAPGEFTQRAFLNGKLDLSAAEAVADVIEAETHAAARAANANLTGALRAEVDAVRASLVTLLEELAGAIDYPDEVPEPERSDVAARIAAAAARLDALVRTWERGRFVREGVAVAIVGPPNAGKSSLLNALLGEERAIVADVAGTTRDTIEETFALDGVPVRVIDTAGLREAGDALEAAGITRTRRALAGAAVALVVIDGSQPLDAHAHAVLVETRERTRIVFINKADVGTSDDAREAAREAKAIVGSVHDAATLARLRAALAEAGWGGDVPDLARAHLASARQADAVARAREALTDARATLTADEPLDLVAPALVDAASALGEVTGAAVAEDVLAGIFARFCVGK